MANPSSFTINQDVSGQRINPFRTATNGLLLKGLFFEISDYPDCVMYTLKDHDHRGFRSLKKLYLAEKDPTEYRFAVKYLDGVEHFEALCKCTWFEPLIAKWRYELELQLKSEALARIMKEAESQSKQAYLANRYLVEKGWKDASAKGRPTKAQVKAEATRIADDQARVANDFDRIIGTVGNA